MSTFKRFEADDIVPANPTEVTVGLWPGDPPTGSLVAFYTSSKSTDVGGAQVTATSGQFYWNVYNIHPSSSYAEVCFAVAYGHRTGGGHPTLDDDDNSTLATQVIYSQYRNLLLDPGDTQFTFAGNYSSDHIYAINIQRNRMRERLDPGNWMLKLSGSNGYTTYIDDSGQSLGATSAYGRSGEVFNVVSGSLSGSLGYTIHSTSASAGNGGYGLCYPSLGLIILNPAAISLSTGFIAGTNNWFSTNPQRVVAPYTGSATTPQYNHAGLYNAIKSGSDFQARSSENISSTHYFVRLRASEFNYSNNPTFFDETDGTLIHPSMIQDPRVYPTTIGLYNDNYELIAVAKLSQPVQKGFDKELNVKVRLDF